MTEVVVERPSVGAPPRPARPPRSAWHRFWKRKPFHRAMVLTHRWPALVLGLLLVVETTAGSVLLYKPELDKLTHPALYATTDGTPVSATQAVDEVRAAHPGFEAYGAQIEQGTWVVYDEQYDTAWFVDPASGHINGSTNTERGFLGMLVNLHDCAFSCEGYPGYQSWMAVPVWSGAPGFLAEATWATVVLGALGLLLILIVVSSLRIWWPGRKRLRSRFTVRWGKGRFARDYDLHNLVGIVALPFLLMWGVTGAAFELPPVKTAWLTITGGQAPVEEEWALEPNPDTADAPAITADDAVATALKDVPGEATGVFLPTEDSPFWEIDVISGYRSAAGLGRADTYVLVDPHDASHFVTLYSARGEPLANRFYDKVFEPAHFGEQVNAWWRSVWLAMGLAPLVLMVTGVSTWLFRRGTTKKRRAAAAQRPLARA